MRLKTDWLVAAALSGIAAIFGRIAAEILFWVIGLFPNIPYYEYVAVLILPPKPLPGYVGLGAFFIAIVASSSVFAIILAYVLLRTGFDYWYLKGAGFGTVTFVSHTSLIPKLWENQLLRVLEAPGVIQWEMVEHIYWGIFTAWLFTWMAGKKASRMRTKDVTTRSG